MIRTALCCVWGFLCLLASSADAQSALTVVNSGPQGEIATLAEAKEVRVVFSEPMVTLGRIPATVRAPFFKISPSVAGTFRWSGTTILIFTPDPKKPLPFATTYQVTIDGSATAISGRKLGRSETFTFTTPTVRLLRTHWYRRGGTVDGPLIVVLRFNQSVKPSDIASHLSATLEPHEWNPPVFTSEEQGRLQSIDPQAIERFTAKVAATRALAAGTAPVAFRVTTDWDKKQFPPSPDLVALEATTKVVPESWVKLRVDESVRSTAGSATPGKPQTFTVQVERAFFIDGFRCRAECEPDRRNPIQIRTGVKIADFAAAASASDVTAAPVQVSKARAAGRRDGDPLDASTHITLEDAGFDAQPPVRKYAVSARADLKAADGQVLGYTWLGVVDNWHQRAFTSFGDGHGVWEKDGGTQLPFYARNFRDIQQWAAPVQPGQLMPTLLSLQDRHFGAAPAGPGANRRLPVTPDRIQSHGLDLSKVLNAGGTGLVWVAVREGETIPKANRFLDGDEPRTRASIVQVTNLGITVKDSPQNTLVFVTRLDTGAPVAGANVSIVRLDNRVFWRGTTGADGIAIAPETPLRSPDDWWKFEFLVTAEKDGDVAYAGSDWHEGISPWDFGTGLNLNEAAPLLRGTVFTDRGVYRLGEEVHLKAILRHNAANGVRLLPGGTPVVVTVRDSQDRLVDERTIRVTSWSSAEWTMTLPENGTLGNYSLRAILESDRPKPKAPEDRQRDVEPGERDDEYVRDEKSVHGSFLVAAYRRPDFRVDVSLKSDTAMAGDALKGIVTARYLFGAPMGTRPVTWSFSKSRGYGAPRNVTDKFTEDRWIFVGWSDNEREPGGDIRRDQATLGRAGDLPLSLETRRDAGVPYVYTLEGDVEDVSRQHIANRASITVHPAPWYIGIRRPSYFLEQKNGLKTGIVAVGLDASPAAGVPVEVKLTQVQWQSVRRAEGNGFYTWETERKEVPAGTWTITTQSDPVPLDIPFKNGGY